MSGRLARPALTETASLLLELAPRDLTWDVLLGLDADELRAHLVNAACILREQAAPGSTRADDVAALHAELNRPTRGDRWAMP